MALALYIIMHTCKYSQSYRPSQNANKALRNKKKSHHHLGTTHDSLHQARAAAEQGTGHPSRRQASSQKGKRLYQG